MENNWKLHHVTAVVRDMDKTIEHYQSLGIATVGSEILINGGDCDYKVNGKSPTPMVKFRIRFVQIGPLQLELVQPIEGKSPHKDFLDSGGDGIYFIAYSVGDLDKETDELVKKGMKVVLSGKTDTVGFAGFDTGKVGNVCIELLQQLK